MASDWSIVRIYPMLPASESAIPDGAWAAAAPPPQPCGGESSPSDGGAARTSHGPQSSAPRRTGVAQASARDRRSRAAV
eukprot:9499671-Pyramimonas_sp.AAC.1